jgi:hypothetical protein
MKPIFISKTNGVTLLEVALTLPIIFYIIFFVLEVMLINRTKVAVDSIVMEATLDFISSKNTKHFDDIIKKYKSANAVYCDIVYYFDVYSDLTALCEKDPYGGEEIFWPIIADGKTTKTYAEGDYLDTNRDGGFMARSSNSLTLTDYSKPELNFGPSKDENFKTLTGKAFILTFVCDYKFSLPFACELLSGGTGTVGEEKFLIWGRGVGVCN